MVNKRVGVREREREQVSQFDMANLLFFFLPFLLNDSTIYCIQILSLIFFHWSIVVMIVSFLASRVTYVHRLFPFHWACLYQPIYFFPFSISLRSLSPRTTLPLWKMSCYEESITIIVLKNQTPRLSLQPVRQQHKLHKPFSETIPSILGTNMKGRTIFMVVIAVKKTIRGD